MTAPEKTEASVQLFGPRVLALGVLATDAELRIAADIVQRFGYTLRLTLTDGVMMVTAEAPVPSALLFAGSAP